MYNTCPTCRGVMSVLCSTCHGRGSISKRYPGRKNKPRLKTSSEIVERRKKIKKAKQAEREFKTRYLH